MGAPVGRVEPVACAQGERGVGCARVSALGIGDSRDRERRFLRRGRPLAKGLGGGNGGITQGHGHRSRGSAARLGEAGMRVFRRDSGHGHGPFHKFRPGGLVRDIRHRDGSLASANDHPQPRLQAFGTFNRFRLRLAHRHIQCRARGNQGIRFVSARTDGGLDQLRSQRVRGDMGHSAASGKTRRTSSL